MSNIPQLSMQEPNERPHQAQPPNVASAAPDSMPAPDDQKTLNAISKINESQLLKILS